MAATKNPFVILQISPSADQAAVGVAFRSLARKFHPDIAGAASTSKMSDINWAYAELTKDLSGWRQRIQEKGTRQGSSRPSPKSPSRSRPVPASAKSDLVVGKPRAWVEVDPQVIIMSGILGARAMFTARAVGAPSSGVKSRVSVGAPIRVERVSDDGPSATFAVTLESIPAFEGDDSFIVPLEIRSPGFFSNSVFVSIQPMRSAVLRQEYTGERIAPPRHASPGARIHFGMHKGRTFAEIAIENPGYLEWLIRENAGGTIVCECARLALGRQLRTFSTPRSGSKRSALPPPTPAPRRIDQPRRPPPEAPPTPIQLSPARLVRPSDNGLMRIVRGLLGRRAGG